MFCPKCKGMMFPEGQCMVCAKCERLEPKMLCSECKAQMIPDDYGAMTCKKCRRKVPNPVCPDCQGEMRLETRSVLVCKRCKNVAQKSAVPKETVAVANVKLDEFGNPIPENELRPEEVAILEDAKTLPTCREECPTCHHNEATYYIRQTRKSDEPPTRFYRCTKCGASWRGY